MNDTATLSEIGSLVSESINPDTKMIDQLDVPELIALINREDHKVAEAVKAELPVIGEAVVAIVSAFRAGGRLIYAGAGTSGRLGVLDASECPPTFSVSPDMVVGIIAGGDIALRTAVEGAEDSAELGASDMAKLNVSDKDVVVGIAASGRTPYAIGVLEEAKKRGAVAVALTSNPGSVLARSADISIAPLVGPEVVTGSTRLKSGTSHKMVLNILTTAAMIRIGKTFGNLMVDLSVSNKKLRTRAINILIEATGVTPDAAEDLLALTDNDVKLAICMQLTGLDVEHAAQKLDAANGVLREAVGAR